MPIETGGPSNITIRKKVLIAALNAMYITTYFVYVLYTFGIRYLVPSCYQVCDNQVFKDISMTTNCYWRISTNVNKNNDSRHHQLYRLLLGSKQNSTKSGTQHKRSSCRSL